jgi:hypothetical protein
VFLLWVIVFAVALLRRRESTAMAGRPEVLAA